MQSATIKELLAGNERFRKKYVAGSDLYQQLARKGQQPKIAVVACSDSRVDPAIITDCDPGDLFVIRNVANLVPPNEADAQHHSTSAALEYAVLHLNVTDIIVLGHSNCGGIQALMTAGADESPRSFITTWMDIARPAQQKIRSLHPELNLAEQARLCEQESLRISCHNLLTFPWLKDRVEQGELRIHAWYFVIETGCIKSLDD